MLYLRRFNESNNYETIKAICDQYRITNWTLNPDGSIDVKGNVDLSGTNSAKKQFFSRFLISSGNNWNLTSLPVKFRNVSGDFNISYNSITSLEGAPQTVGGTFYIYENNLTSLEGCPQEVDRFVAYNNKLTSLVGAPRIVRGDFNFNQNFVTTLDGAPEYVGGYFELNGNPLNCIKSFPRGFHGKVWLRSKPLLPSDEKYYQDDSFIFENGFYYPPIAEILFIFLGENCTQLSNNRSTEWGDMIYEEIGGTLIDIINEWDMIQGNNIIWRRLVEAHDSFCSALSKIPNTQFDGLPFKCKELVNPMTLRAQLEKKGNYKLIL